VGVPRVYGASTRASPRSCMFCRRRSGTRVVQVFRRVRGFFQVKAQRFDAWGYHHHLEGVVMVTSGVLGIWVKTLDLAVSTTTVHASLPS
jgi:hypothetical protein